MDLLASQGELSPEDQAELEALSKDELVALVTSTNRSWYQLLERLEDAHRLDLQELETRLRITHQQELEQLDEHLRSTYDSVLSAISKRDTTELDSKWNHLSDLEKKLATGLDTSKENAGMLKGLKKTLDRLTNERTGGR